MRILDVIKRPRVCPHCRGEVCDIIWGMPVFDWEERHFKETGRKAVLGGCCVSEDGDPQYQCEDCGLQFQQYHFPRKAQAIARKALIDTDGNLFFTDVKHIGIYKGNMVFEPVVREGIVWDSRTLVLVDELGQAKLVHEKAVARILKKLQKDKELLKPKHNEKFYWQCAMRELRYEEDMYRTAHKIGMYRGKRAYQPIFIKEYEEEPLCIGFPLIILVDKNGKTNSVRDFISLDIYNAIFKANNAKRRKNYKKKTRK